MSFSAQCPAEHYAALGPQNRKIVGFLHRYKLKREPVLALNLKTMR